MDDVQYGDGRMDELLVLEVGVRAARAYDEIFEIEKRMLRAFTGVKWNGHRQVMNHPEGWRTRG